MGNLGNNFIREHKCDLHFETNHLFYILDASKTLFP